MGDHGTDFSGTILDQRFRLHRLVGAGGMGQVYEATQLSVERRVAVKILPTERLGERARERFFREARAVAGVEHPCIIRIVDFGEDVDAGLLYLAMDYVEGGSLWDVMRHGALRPEVALQLGIRLAAGLEEAHRSGVVHRDLKPDNVMLSVASDGRVEPVIVDFGIARMDGAGEPRLTETGEVIGTPGYMAPEQARGGHATTSVDLYALGAILFEAVSGRELFPASSAVEMLMRKMQEDAPSVAEAVDGSKALDPRAVALIDQLVAREERHRPDTASEVHARLATILGDRVLLTTDPSNRYADWFEATGTTPRERTLETTRPRAAGRPTVREAPGNQPPGRSAVRSFATLVSVAAGVAGLLFALFWGVSRLADDPTPRPSTTSVPTPPAAPAAVLAVPEARPPDVPDLAPSPPTCAPFDFEHELTVGTPVSGTWSFYAPRSYDPSVPHPVVVLFHNTGSNAARARDDLGFRELADEQGFVLLSLQTPPTEENQFVGDLTLRAWRNDWPVIVAHFERAMRSLRESYCVDPERIYAVAHGSGVFGMWGASCRTRAFAATASVGGRPTGGTLHNCGPERPQAHISIVAKEDEKFPIDGGATPCRPDVEAPDREESDELWKTRNGCGGKPRPYPTDPDGDCRTWSCERPYVSCVPDGPGGWGTDVRRTEDLSVQVAEMFLEIADCEVLESDFPFARVAWSFLKDYRSASSEEVRTPD